MLPVILGLVEKRGHRVFTKGDFNLNIVGVRNLASTQTNDFDDMICVCYKQSGNWITQSWTATTDPGTYYLNTPMNIDGTAILCAGQYSGVYSIDKHANSYEALCQRNGKVRVFRDSNKDEVLDHDPESLTEGYYGINIHRAHRYRSVDEVNRFSAGCQVFRNPSDFADFMRLCHKSADKYGNSFTYTLIEL